MDEQVERTIAALAERERRRAFNGAQLASNRIGADTSRGLRLAADNLLDKAVRQLAAGDRDGARRFAEKALALPFDEHEEEQPGRWMAHMRLYLALGDELDRGRPSWIDDVVALAGSSAGWLRTEVAAVITILLAEYRFPADERRRLQPFAGEDVNEEPFRDVPADELPDVVLDVVDSARRFAAAGEA